MRLTIFLLFCVGIAAAVPLQSRDADDPEEVPPEEEVPPPEEEVPPPEEEVPPPEEEVPPPEEEVPPAEEEVMPPIDDGAMEAKMVEFVDNMVGRIQTMAEEGNGDALWQKLNDELDAEEFEGVMKLMFGEESEMTNEIIEMVKASGVEGKHSAMDWIGIICPEREKRFLNEMFGNVKGLLSNFQENLKNKYTKVGEWVKNKYNQGMQKGKDNIESMKIIGQNLVKDIKNMGNEMAQQSLQMVKDYQKGLGKIYQETVSKVGTSLKG